MTTDLTVPKLIISGKFKQEEEEESYWISIIIISMFWLVFYILGAKRSVHKREIYIYTYVSNSDQFPRMEGDSISI